MRLQLQIQNTMKTKRALVVAGFVITGLLSFGIGVGVTHWYEREARAAASLVLVADAMQAMDRKETAKALALLNKASIANPDSYLIFQGLAELYEQEGVRDLAIENYMRAKELLESDPNSLGIGFVQRRLERLQR